MLSAAVLASAASSVAAAATLDVKPGVGVEQLRADSALCTQEARTGARSGAAAIPPSGNVAGQAGAALVVGFLEGMSQARAQTRLIDSCMRRKGYAKLTLTAEEAAALQSLPDDAGRQSWIAAFLARDNSERIARATTLAVPPLPSAPAKEAFSVHGVRLLPESLVPPAGVVERRAAVLSGRASYRSGGLATEGFELGGMLKARIEPGTVLHLVETRSELDPTESSRWCGPFTHGTVWGKRVTRPGCLSSTLDGYSWALWPEEYQPLLTESINAPLFGLQREGALKLAPATTEADVPVELRLSGLSAKAAEFELVSLASAKPVPIARFRALFDPDGRAHLPFWSKRLTLSKSGKGVLVALSGDGNGAGPEPV